MFWAAERSGSPQQTHWQWLWAALQIHASLSHSVTQSGSSHVNVQHLKHCHLRIFGVRRPRCNLSDMWHVFILRFTTLPKEDFVAGEDDFSDLAEDSSFQTIPMVHGHVNWHRVPSRLQCWMLLRAACSKIWKLSSHTMNMQGLSSYDLPFTPNLWAFTTDNATYGIWVCSLTCAVLEVWGVVIVF